MFTKRWEAQYKGHRITVENKPFSERLFIDDNLAAESKGMGGMAARLKASLRDDDGTAIDVVAVLYVRFITVECSIVIGHELESHVL